MDFTKVAALNRPTEKLVAIELTEAQIEAIIVAGLAAPIPENTRKFAILQRYNRLNLLIPVNTPHMWNAAMESKTCRLTALGEHYRRLVEKNRI